MEILYFLVCDSIDLILSVYTVYLLCILIIWSVKYCITFSPIVSMLLSYCMETFITHIVLIYIILDSIPFHVIYLYFIA